MSTQSVSIYAEEIFDGGTVGIDPIGTTDLESVHVSLAGEARCNGDEEAGAEWRCIHCGAVVTDPGATDCDDCNGRCDGDDCTVDHYCEGEPIPLSWANSAGITLDEEHDTLAVRISVGDPRGAFVLSVERVRWTDGDGDHDELRLSVPTPEDGWLHMPLTPLASPGYYRIGS